MTLANWIHPLLFRGGAEWSPLDMEHLEIWLDASQIVGLADGDPLAIWPDMSGKGNAALQGVGANQPTYLVGIQNGLPVIRFDGATDHLTCGDLETFYSNIAGRGLSVFAVCQHPLWARKAICGKYNAGLGQRMFSFESSINYFQENAGGYNPNTNAALTDNAAWRIVSFSWEPGGRMSTYINGFLNHNAIAVLNDLSDVTVDLLIGWGDPNAGTWNGDFAAQLFFSDSIVGDNMATLVAFLMDKWGVVDPYAGNIVYDTFEDPPATALVSHIPNRDLVGGGWKVARWAGPGRVIAGDLCDMADWPNHGGNVIDAGVDDVELGVTMTFKVGNYVGFMLCATGGGVGDFAGYSCVYQAGLNRWLLSDGYPGGGGEGNYDFHNVALDETGATPYEMKMRRIGNEITVLMDDVEIMSATSSKYDGNTHHGITGWSDDGGTWDDFYIAAL